MAETDQFLPLRLDGHRLEMLPFIMVYFNDLKKRREKKSHTMCVCGVLPYDEDTNRTCWSEV